MDMVNMVAWRGVVDKLQVLMDNEGMAGSRSNRLTISIQGASTGSRDGNRKGSSERWEQP